MKKGIAKFTAFCLAAGMTLGEGGAVYFAAPADNQTKNTSGVTGSRGFARCNEYLNVRASADTEGEVVGKIYNNGSMDILGVDENGWYHVRSGNVEGYVAGQFVATGSEAQAIAATAGYTTAQVGVEALNVRASASTDSDIVTTVTGTSEIEVVEDQGDWVKVVLDGGVYGYVSHDYVDTKTSYATGETVAEEQARLDAQWLAYLASQGQSTSGYQGAASNDSYVSGESTYTENTYTENTGYTEAAPAYTDSSDLSATASSLYAVYLDAQQAADDAVANGSDEQTINDTCAAAQNAYAQYVQAQDAADAAAYSYSSAAGESSASTGSTAQSTTYQETSYTETYTDSSDLSATASSLYDAYLAAQQAADAAVANGSDEQTINDTCAAAQSAYAQYVQAQDAADEAYYSGASTQSSGSDAGATQAAAVQETPQEAPAQETPVQEAPAEEAPAQETPAAEAPAASSAGSAAANYALQFVGNPYVWGGSSLTGGADCSGFTMAVLANFGVSLPHNAAAQSGCGTSVSMDNLQPGDLLFYGDGISHVAMYIGGGQVVHASNPTNGIRVSNYNYRTPVAARRYL